MSNPDYTLSSGNKGKIHKVLEGRGGETLGETKTVNTAALDGVDAKNVRPRGGTAFHLKDQSKHKQGTRKRDKRLTRKQRGGKGVQNYGLKRNCSYRGGGIPRLGQR